MLPRIVMDSEVLQMHLLDVLQKEFHFCLTNLRKGIFNQICSSLEENGNLGLNYTAPCSVIANQLGDYLRVTCDHFPYRFYMTSKTTAYAASYQNEKPSQTIRLNTYDRKLNYKLFTFHVLILESAFPNVYFGMLVRKAGMPISDTMGSVRFSGNL